jgi:protein O-GlcNAc transferase
MANQTFRGGSQARNSLADALGEAVMRHQQGDFAEARRLYKFILREDPKNFDALRLLGVVEAQRGHHDKALRLIRDALRINPGSAEAQFSRGTVLVHLRRWEEAIACFDKTLAIDPDHSAALVNRGNALLQLGKPEDALASFERALEIDPTRSDAQNNRGNVLLELSRFESALASFDQALAINPGHPGTLVNRGNVLLRLRRLEEALSGFDKALEHDPRFADGWNNRGNVLLELGRLDEALASFEKALEIDPGFADALANRGFALMSARRFDAAAQALQQLLELNPQFPFGPGNLWYAKLRCCDWRGLDRLKSQIEIGLRAGKPTIMPFAYTASFESPAGQLRASATYAQSVCPHRIAEWQGPRYRHDRIRLAYFSSDFRAHATGYVMAELFERHDRARFETVAMSFGFDDGSEMQSRLRAAFDRFVDVKGKSDREIAALARDMEIDIAVDLKGFTENSRPGIFALRPAPVAASYMGFPATMGTDFIDYIIADRFVIPETETSSYSEKVAYLPDSYWVNDSKKRIAERTPSRAEAGLPETGFVFCCFNNSYKIRPEFFDVWMRLLHKVEGSVLWLFEGNPAVGRNLRQEAKARGIAPDRLIFAPRMALADHLARHRLANLFLDTLPYNAHTTATDALWVGLPVLTCTGSTFVGRVCASLLNAIAMPEMITGSVDAYEALALKLATDAQALAAVREKLVRNRASQPLFDTDRFRRHFEAALVTMHERHQAGAAPASFSVEPLSRVMP